MADENDNGSRNAWLYLAAATQFTTSPIAGGAVGYFVDSYLKTGKQTWALIGFGLGFIAGTINLVRILKIPTKTP